jgi:hypothetical protein
VPLLLAALVVVPVAVIALVLAQRDDDDAATGADAGDVGMSHVHGLGINPADGSLVIATHTGLFRLGPDSGTVERIGESFQDTMGFTVVGPDRFYGSGHPDVAGMRAGQPGLLGLIQSSDAGRTWVNLSLPGRVDFHGLSVVDDTVLGWDSGTQRFMVSSDGRSWDSRATLPILGFAVDPADSHHLIAAAPDGLLVSSDEARTWQDLPGPSLVVISWDATSGLWGADGGGGVWHGTGSEWEPAGSLHGSPQAFLATPDTLYAAAHAPDGQTAIYQSDDDGKRWTLRYEDLEA